MRRLVLFLFAVAVALAAASVALGHHDPKPDPLRGKSHVAEYRYLLETMQITRLTNINPITLPSEPLEVLVHIRMRVRTHDNNDSFFVVNYDRNPVDRFSFGRWIYLHEDCTPDERPPYFYARAILLPRTYQLPADLKPGARISTTSEESLKLRPELDRLMHDKQAIVVGQLDSELNPDVHRDTVGTNRRGFHVEWTIRPSYVVSGKLCRAKTGSPPRSKLSEFTVGPMGFTWVGMRSDGAQAPGHFELDSATACGRDELHAGWTTTQHASTSNDVIVHVGPLEFAYTNPFQIYTASVTGGTMEAYLRYIPGSPSYLQLEPVPGGRVTVGQSARQPITATPVAAC